MVEQVDRVLRPDVTTLRWYYYVNRRRGRVVEPDDTSGEVGDVRYQLPNIDSPEWRPGDVSRPFPPTPDILPRNLSPVGLKVSDETKGRRLPGVSINVETRSQRKRRLFLSL